MITAGTIVWVRKGDAHQGNTAAVYGFTHDGWQQCVVNRTYPDAEHPAKSILVPSILVNPVGSPAGYWYGPLSKVRTEEQHAAATLIE